MAALPRESEMRCKTCGYDLRGAPAERCPECGSRFDRGDPWSYVRWPKSGRMPLWIAMWGAIMFAAAFGAIALERSGPVNGTLIGLLVLMVIPVFSMGGLIFSTLAFVRSVWMLSGRHPWVEHKRSLVAALLLSGIAVISFLALACGGVMMQLLR